MKFHAGLVVGKFCPLHKGHELLIRTALADCDNVVVISYAKPGYARCEREQRQHWLNKVFPTLTSLVIDDAWLQTQAEQGVSLQFTEVPHDDEPEHTHRLFTAWACHTLLGETVDAVFTSEEYGDGFAQVLTEYFRENASQTQPVSHVCVDKARAEIPISGTDIRKDPFKHPAYLSDTVYAAFVDRVVIYGGESTGKTSLCEALAQHFEAQWVPEYGRELWEEKGGALELSDMLRIGETQIRRETDLIRQADRFLFCDTSPLTTLFYSQYMFDEVDPELEKLAMRHYSHTFLCAPDFTFVQDGTRKGAAFRDRQHAWYIKALTAHEIDYTLLTGDMEARVLAVLRELGSSRENLSA